MVSTSGRLNFSDKLCFVASSRAAQRTAKDYAYVSANDEHRGPSDPGSYSVSCKYERMIALMRTGLERYNAEMARVAVERERQAKDAALQVPDASPGFVLRYGVVVPDKGWKGQKGPTRQMMFCLEIFTSPSAKRNAHRNTFRQR